MMNRDLLLTTLILSILVGCEIYTFTFSDVSSGESSTLEEMPISGSTNVVTYERSWSTPSESRNDEIQIVKVCQGVVERMQVTGETTVKTQSPMILIFLNAPEEMLSSLKAVYQSGSDHPELLDVPVHRLNTTTASQTAHDEFQGVIEEGVELCVGYDKTPRQVSLEASNFRDEIAGHARAFLRIPRLDLKLQAKLRLYIRIDHEVVEKEFKLEDYRASGWISPQSYSHDDLNQEKGS